MVWSLVVFLLNVYQQMAQMNLMNLVCGCCSTPLHSTGLLSMNSKYITINGQEFNFLEMYRTCMKISNQDCLENHKICEICCLQIENVYRIRLKYVRTHPTSLPTAPETEIKEEEGVWGHEENVFVLDSSEQIDDGDGDFVDDAANFQDYEDSDDEPLITTKVAVPSELINSVGNQGNQQSTEKSSSLDQPTDNETKPVACNVCHKLFHDEKKLNSHMVSHGQNKPFQCKLCKRSFKHQTSLCTHIKTKHSGEDYPKERKAREKQEDVLLCTHCGKTFKFQSLLDGHIDRYSKYRKYKCSVCAKTYKNKSILNQHIKLKHSSKGPKVFQCQQCASSFLSYTGLYDHSKRAHSDKPPCFECSRCGKTFETSGGLRYHTKTFHLKIRLECETCKKQFLSKTGLWEHSFDHLDRYPFICPDAECDFQTKNKQSFQIHLVIRHDIKYDEALHGYDAKEGIEKYKERVAAKTISITSKPPKIDPSFIHKCPKCPSAFKSSGGFNNHVNTKHKNIFIECKFCDKKFTTRLSLWKHSFDHRDLGAPYNCADFTEEGCKYKTRQKAHFQYHLDQKHNIKYIEAVHGFKKYSSKEIIDFVIKTPKQETPND